MRIVVVVALLAFGCDEEATTTRAPAAPVAAAKKKADECRDGCEQNLIVTGGGDAELRACRARCDAAAGVAPTPPHEVPSKITVAPPVHAPPNVRPLRK